MTIHLITIYSILWHCIWIYINLYVCYIHTANARHALKQAGMKQAGMHSEEWAVSGTELPVNFEVGESSAARGFVPTALARSCLTVHSQRMPGRRASRQTWIQSNMHAHRLVSDRHAAYLFLLTTYICRPRVCPNGSCRRPRVCPNGSCPEIMFL